MAGGTNKEKLTDTIQKEFEDEMPGIGFNFSQYIQDNVEEALSGVKGANSIKIVGPNLTKLEELADQVLAEVQQVKGIERSRHIPCHGSAQSQYQGGPGQGRALRTE